jgi:hypothetical protein
VQKGCVKNQILGNKWQILGFFKGRSEWGWNSTIKFVFKGQRWVPLSFLVFKGDFTLKMLSYFDKIFWWVVATPWNSPSGSANEKHTFNFMKLNSEIYVGRSTQSCPLFWVYQHLVTSIYSRATDVSTVDFF